MGCLAPADVASATPGRAPVRYRPSVPGRQPVAGFGPFSTLLTHSREPSFMPRT